MRITLDLGLSIRLKSLCHLGSPVISRFTFLQTIRILVWRRLAFELFVELLRSGIGDAMRKKLLLIKSVEQGPDSATSGIPMNNRQNSSVFQAGFFGNFMKFFLVNLVLINESNAIFDSIFTANFEFGLRSLRI